MSVVKFPPLPVEASPPAPLRPHLFLLISLLLFLCVGQARAGEKIAVLYPDAPAPYRSVFDGILTGVRSQGGPSFSIHCLPKDYDQEELNRRLRKSGVDGVIALGRRGYKASKALDLELPTVFGALRVAPGGVSGISLAADPHRIFGYLKSLAPKVERIFTVYTPKINGWLIPVAEAAAKEQGLTLIAFAADNLQDAMRHYRKFLGQMDADSDSIWLPLDPVTADDDVVLPMLLHEAWARGLVVFSSKPFHARRGTLFSVLPDNEAMGKRLAEMTTHLDGDSAEPEVIPVADLRLAVNLRTADHLGLRFTPEQEQGFDFTFSSR